MARIPFTEDPITGDRIVVTPKDQTLEASPLHGQCDCGASIRVPRNGNTVECSDCGVMYRAKPDVTPRRS